MAEPWTQEQFEDHWYAWAPPGSFGEAVPCDCDDERCHGWRMAGIYVPPQFHLFDGTESGIIFDEVHVDRGLKAGESAEITQTVTFT